MAQKFTIFLPDGTPLRAGVSAKPGLPATLAPAALATRYSTYTLADGQVRFGDGLRGARPPAGSGANVGANYTPAHGSARMFQPNQSDLAFLMNRAGCVPLEQITQAGPGVLFLNCQGTPAPEIDNFLKRLELALGRTGQAIPQLKIKANLTQTPTAPAQTSTPGARTVPSQFRTILLAPSPAAHNLMARGPAAPAVPPAGIDRLTQVFEKTFTIVNVFPTQLGGAAATASQGGSIAMEEITLAHEGIRIP